MDGIRKLPGIIHQLAEKPIMVGFISIVEPHRLYFFINRLTGLCRPIRLGRG